MAVGRKVFPVLVSVLLACYPLLIFFGLETLPLKQVAGGILALFVLRFLFLGYSRLHFLKSLGWPVAACGLALSCISLVMDSDIALLLYPVLVSLSCLTVFSWTLIYPPSMIECFARMAEGDIPEEAVAYTRRVTQVWCGFFVMNAAVAGFTVAHGDRTLWTLYNGLISYVLMGCLLGGEWLYRKWILRQP